MNGYQPQATGTQHSPPPPPFPENNGEPHIIRVNLGLSWRHLAAGIMAFSGAVGSLTAAGWLALPAKQSDLTRVEQSLQTVEKDLKNQQEITLKLIQAVERLDTSVKAIRINAPRPKTKR